MTAFRVLMISSAAALWGGTAHAALKICNDTAFVQSVSVGYQGEDDWASEGWWNVDPGACSTVIAADLGFRYYYYRAEVDGGDFDGENYFFCTSPEEYTIIGDSECEGRGHDREKFREIDVGEGVTDYTLTMIPDVAAPAPEAAPEAAPETAPEAPAETAELGLKICNETDDIQAISIGYDGDSGWTSEGWWNVDPNACSTLVGGALKLRYYYYRAEVAGGPFGAGAVPFCTTPQEYTIIGEADCEARGYDTEDFAEIDVGEGSKGYTLTLGAETAAPDVTTPPVSEPVAEGGLTFCNKTDVKQELSIGYQRGADWVSEGWWNIEREACVKVLAGTLTEAYYYYRAEVGGGDFDGGGYFFCTSPEVYEIVGDTDCEARGYVREDFAEINVGAGTPQFTFSLVNSTDGTAETPPAPEPTPEASPEPETAEGLRICNETTQNRVVAIGYQDDEVWTSEGWWSMEPRQCATVLPGVLQKRYYTKWREG